MVLGNVLRQWRWAEKLTVREAAKIIGIAFPTLSRIESGQDMDGKTLARILNWMTGEATERKIR